MYRELDIRLTTICCENDDFIGKAALLKQRQDGVRRRFTQFLLDDFDVHHDLWPWGGEPIYRNGQFAGVTTTCSYGFTLEKMVCLGFVSQMDENGEMVTQKNINEWVMSKNAKYEIDIAGTLFPARSGIYTPKMSIQTQEPLFVPAPNILHPKQMFSAPKISQTKQ